MTTAPVDAPAKTEIPAQPGTGRGRRSSQQSRPSVARLQLRVVPVRQRPARAPFVILVTLILGGGLVFLLLVNTWLAAGSFTINGLQTRQSALSDQVQALSQQVADESTPQQLARRAIALGMVPAPNPVFRAPTGAVLGVQTAAQAPPKPVPSPTAIPTPSPTPSASTSATPSASATPSGSATPSRSVKPSSPAKPGSSGAATAKSTAKATITTTAPKSAPTATKAPTTKAPTTKAPTTKTPTAKTPTAKTPTAKTPATKSVPTPTPAGTK